MRILHGVCDMVYVLDPKDVLKIRYTEKANALSQIGIAVIGNTPQQEVIELVKDTVSFTILNESFLNWKPHTF